ncbi:MAG: CotH kinase family protein [Eubacteriales bacterium]|nr:CotH kinase family protein [Eubacteriales bacterium]
MYTNLKKRTLIPVLALMLAALAAAGILCTRSAYAAETGSVHFKEAYASQGENLTVQYDGDAKNVTYRWYMDDKQIACKSTKYCVTSDDLEKMIRVEAWDGQNKVAECSMLCSKLPVVYINTDGGAAITSKENYIQADCKIQGCDKYNADNTTLYDGRTEIRGRGNSTWKNFDKKPYKLKLDKKTDLFGMGKNKHWALIANYIDESCMRNALASYYGKKIGTEAMDSVWVDVVMNGKYAGNYQLMETVRMDKNRVNAFDWEKAAGDIAEKVAKKEGLSKDDEGKLEDQLKSDLDWMTSDTFKFNGKEYTASDYYDKPNAVNGGYLIEMDSNYDEASKFKTDRDVPLQFKSPEFISSNNQAFSGIQNYMQKVEDAIYSADKCVPDVAGKRVSYVDLCDMDSLTTFWLSSELMRNEIGWRSTYMYKDIDSPLHFGPIWDFDFGSDSVAPFGPSSAVSWASNGRWWFSEIMKDPYFAVKARELYLDKEDELKAPLQDNGVLNQWHDYIKESAHKNEELWHYSRGFEEDSKALKTWLNKRINWMDKQFASDESTMKSMNVNLSDKFTLKFDGDDVTHTNAQAYEAVNKKSGEYRLNVDIGSGSYQKLSYYVNGHYIGTMNIKDKNSANLLLDSSLFTEPVGKKNVVTVWLQNSDKEYNEQQYCTLTLTDGKTSYCNVELADYGKSTVQKVKSGGILRVPAPTEGTKDMLFDGWKQEDGKIVTPGSRITVTSDMALRAVYRSCTDGDVHHDWQKKGDDYECSRCHADKADDNTYVDVNDCSYTQSVRYKVRYTGKPVAPTITVTYGDTVLTAGKDYKITFKNNVNIGYATYTVTGIKEAGFTGRAEQSYRIVEREIKDVPVKLKSTKLTYSGKDQKPAVSLAFSGIALKSGKDYTVSVSNGKNVGTGTVKITGKGNFTGTKTATFQIVPKSASITKAKALKGRKISLRWKSTKNQVSGYEIAYSTHKNYSTGKTVRVAKKSATSKTIKVKLAKKKYYVKVRAYKTVKGKRIYSSWSKSKTLKTKK